jgi:predicted MFS family arabinose efflux permease
LAGTLVDNGTLLIITRFLKGAAAAFTAPAALSIITTTFAEGAGRNRALGIFAACSASGFTMGLILGGLLTEIGWRWTFVLPVPIALVLLLSASRLIPHEAPGDLDGRRRLDLWGAVTVTAGMLLLVDTVVRAPEIGWTAGGTLIGFAITALLLAGFVGIEQRVAHPLVRLGILRNLSLVRANLGAAGVFGSYFGFQFIGTLYLQSTLGWSPLQTGLGFLPSGLIVAFGAPRVWVLVNRYGTQRIFGLGALGFLSAYLLFLRIDAAPVYVAVIMPSMVLIGIAFALCFPSLNLQATNGVADQEQGLASGLLNTSFQLGGAIGLAITSAVISSGLAHGDSALDAYKPAIVVVAGIAALAFLAALSGLLPNRRAAAPQPSD